MWEHHDVLLASFELTKRRQERIKFTRVFKEDHKRCKVLKGDRICSAENLIGWKIK